MERTALTAGPEAAGERLDSFLAARLPGLTRSAAARLIAVSYTHLTLPTILLV